MWSLVVLTRWVYNRVPMYFIFLQKDVISDLYHGRVGDKTLKLLKAGSLVFKKGHLDKKTITLVCLISYKCLSM